MDISTGIKGTWEVVKASKKFDDLELYKDPGLWQKITKEDRSLLAHMFLLQGEHLLAEGARGELEPFNYVMRLMPDDPDIYCCLAAAYGNYSDSQDSLERAQRFAMKAHDLNPKTFGSLYMLANTLVFVGIRTADAQCFYKADEKYSEAFWHPEFKEMAQPDFFWQWGVCWHYIAKNSGEPSDYLEAIKKYKEADKRGLQDPIFVNDYGNTLVDISCLMNQTEYLLEASNMYQRVVTDKGEFFEGWFNLACCEQRLWLLTNEERHFFSAEECFDKSSRINPRDPTLWFKWGIHLAITGRERMNLKLIEASIDKFMKADTYQPDHPQILSYWAEALMLLGKGRESLEELRLAETKIARTVDLQPENSNHWFIYGSCLIELGNYFADEDYYTQAIEKFNQGLIYNKADPQLWQGLANAYYLMGDLLEDASLLYKASLYFTRLMEFCDQSNPRIWNDWGIVLMRLGEIKQEEVLIHEASEKFENALRLHQLHRPQMQIDPSWLYNYASAALYLGEMAGEIKQVEKAIKLLSQVLSLQPEHPHAKFSLACSYVRLGQMVSELECYQRASQIYMEITAANNEDDMAWNDWGYALMHMAELVKDPAHMDFSNNLIKEAEEKFMRAASLGNVLVFYNLACMHSFTGNLATAMVYIEKASELDALPPLDEMIHDEWLEELRTTHKFRSFISGLRHLGS